METLFALCLSVSLSTHSLLLPLSGIEDILRPRRVTIYREHILQENTICKRTHYIHLRPRRATISRERIL